MEPKKQVLSSLEDLGKLKGMLSPEVAEKVEKLHSGEITMEEVRKDRLDQMVQPIIIDNDEELQLAIEAEEAANAQRPRLLPVLGQDKHDTIDPDDIVTPEIAVKVLANHLLEEAGLKADAMVRSQRHANEIISNYTAYVYMLLAIAEELEVKIRSSRHPSADKDGFVVVNKDDHPDKFTPKDMHQMGMYMVSAVSQLKTKLQQLTALVDKHEQVASDHVQSVKAFKEQLESGEDFITTAIQEGMNIERSEFAKEMLSLKNQVDSRFVRYTVQDDRPYIIHHSKKIGTYLTIDSTDAKPPLDSFKTVNTIAKAKKFPNLKVAAKALERMQRNRKLVNVKNPHRYIISKIELISVMKPEKV